MATTSWVRVAHWDRRLSSRPAAGADWLHAAGDLAAHLMAGILAPAPQIAPRGHRTPSRARPAKSRRSQFLPARRSRRADQGAQRRIRQRQRPRGSAALGPSHTQRANRQRAFSSPPPNPHSVPPTSNPELSRDKTLQQQRLSSAPPGWKPAPTITAGSLGPPAFQPARPARLDAASAAFCAEWPHAAGVSRLISSAVS